MKQNGIKILIAILTVVSIAGVSGIAYLLLNDDDPNRELTLAEQAEYAHMTEEINLDLADQRYVQLQFNILTDSDEARDEMELREFQFKNILIKETIDMTADELQSGLSDFESKLEEEMNKLMVEGKITDIYIVGKIVQ